MAPTRIPEGSVFVPGRSVETATALLKAADKIKADRKLDVRTTTGGYHVTQAVAEEYQKAFPDAALQEADEPAEVVSEHPDGEPGHLAGEPVGDGDQTPPGEIVNADGTQAPKDENGTPVLTEVQEKEPEPLGVTLDNTREEIDKYGSELDPPVDTTKAANKADAIALLEDARKPQNPAE